MRIAVRLCNGENGKEEVAESWGSWAIRDWGCSLTYLSAVRPGDGRFSFFSLARLMEDDEFC